jgi:hypothetical protein
VWRVPRTVTPGYKRVRRVPLGSSGYQERKKVDREVIERGGSRGIPMSDCHTGVRQKVPQPGPMRWVRSPAVLQYLRTRKVDGRV